MSAAGGSAAQVGPPTECRVLGPLEVRVGGQPVNLGGRKQRLVLATLLLAAGRAVSTDRLIDVVWGDEVAEGVRNTLQVHVSGLRRALHGSGAPWTVLRRDPGYFVTVAPDQLDLLRFRQLVDAGTTALREGRAEAAVTALDEALGLWRGPALADLVGEPGLLPDLEALEESRLAAVGTRMEAHLALGRHAALVGELRDLVTAAPLHEHLRALLVRALYGSGRAGDALAVLREGRRVLADELGADPGPELRDLERAGPRRRTCAARSGRPIRWSSTGTARAAARRPPPPGAAAGDGGPQPGQLPVAGVGPGGLPSARTAGVVAPGLGAGRLLPERLVGGRDQGAAPSTAAERGRRPHRRHRALLQVRRGAERATGRRRRRHAAGTRRSARGSSP